MRQTVIKTLWPLLAASCLYGCGQNGNASTGSSAAAKPQTGAGGNPFDVCADKDHAIMVGDKGIELELAGKTFHWSTAGNKVTLTQGGDPKAVDLVVSTAPGGPSLPAGDCLRSGNYIRLARSGGTGTDIYLQALLTDGVDPGAHPDPNVVIGNFPDPRIDSIFNIIKPLGITSNSTGAIIRQGDVVQIRGVSHDPWLTAPAPAEGSLVALSDSYGEAAKWTITRHGPPGGGN